MDDGVAVVSESWSVLIPILGDDPMKNVPSEAKTIWIPMEFYVISLLSIKSCHQVAAQKWDDDACCSLSITRKDIPRKKTWVVLVQFLANSPKSHVSRFLTTPAPCRRRLTWHEAAPLRRPWQGHAVGSHLVRGPADVEERCSAGDFDFPCEHPKSLKYLGLDVF